MITWAYSLDSDKSLIKDFAVGQAGDTIATQTNGTAGAYVAAKGDIVSLNDQGRVSKAANASNYLTATAVLGVCEGGNFLGLAAGGTWAATAANQNDVTGPLAKVHVSTTDVYRIDLKSGATAPVIGVAHEIYFDATNGAQLDTADAGTGSKIFKVIDFNATTNKAFGVFTALEFVS
jgi:hypothetical protein